MRTEVYEDAVLASRAREVLGADEGAALARLRPEAARRDYLAAHALARTMLAELAGSDPARLRFRCPPRGRPELVAPPAARHLRFSISHADGIALCAVAAGCVVGADVESLRNVGPDPLGVAASVCSRREMDALAMLPASARAERLLSIWTAKEAVAKAYLPAQVSASLAFAAIVATVTALAGIAIQPLARRLGPIPLRRTALAMCRSSRSTRRATGLRRSPAPGRPRRKPPGGSRPSA